MEKIKIIKLTEIGMAKAKSITLSTDLRINSLNKVSRDDRAWLALYGYYAMAFRAGITCQDTLNMIDVSRSKINELLKSLKVSSPELLIYNPSLQEKDDILSRASELLE
jgi:hypothetical protein